MSVYKDKNGTWYAEFRYKDWSDDPLAHAIFNLLFRSGMREGEALA